MKKYLSIAILVMLYNLNCFGQEIGFGFSYNTSSEPRFQNAYGIGIQYQQLFLKRFKAEIAFHYNFHNTSFIENDNSFFSSAIYQKIISYPRRFSSRLNLQFLVKNNDFISISIGPEISENYLWSNEKRYDRSYIPDPFGCLTRYKVPVARDYGFGFVTKVEIKDLFLKRVTMFLSFRREFLRGEDYNVRGDYDPIYTDGLNLSEFQIGLSYEFKHKKKGHNQYNRCLPNG